MAPPDKIAAVIVVRTVADPADDNPHHHHQARVDLVGRDCATVEEGLGHLREALALLDSWEIASLVPDVTIAELRAAGRI